MRHGFLLVDKPLGFTSHDIVQVVRKKLGERSIGHLGTLDPAASGLLVLAVGSKALKVIELFTQLTKEYDAQITLGSVSTTYDREGIIEATALKPGWTIPTKEDLQHLLLTRFSGMISQTPPAFSAVHVNGVRAHELARQGQAVTLRPRDRELSCGIVAYEYPVLSVRVQCSPGTYIRSLANDLGHAVRCGGYLSGLRRTKVGEWDVAAAVIPDQCGWSDVLSLKEILRPFPHIDLSDEEFDHVKHGRPIKHGLNREVVGWHEQLPVAIIVPIADLPGKAQGRKVL